MCILKNNISISKPLIFRKCPWIMCLQANGVRVRMFLSMFEAVVKLNIQEGEHDILVSAAVDSLKDLSTESILLLSQADSCMLDTYLTDKSISKGLKALDKKKTNDFHDWRFEDYS